MSEINIQKKNSLKQNLFIFIGTAFFAIHTLTYIINFRLNFPHGDDILVIPFAYEYVKTGQFPVQDFFASASSHLTYSLKLISLPNLLWNSFDMVNFYYLQWILMSLTLLFIFLIIRQTDKRLFWILVPISASIYCPIFITGYYVFSTVMWLSVSLCITIVVYLVTRKKITPIITFTAISVLTYSTFFNLIGLMAWIPGLISFLRKDSEKKRSYKKWLIPWFIAASILGIIILSNAPSISEQSKLHLFLSIDGLNFLATYLATSYRLGSENIVISRIIGFITLGLVGCLVYYFLRINKENFQNAFPWLILILVSILSGMYIAIGRMDLGYHDGNESFYKTISFFSQIGITALVSIIFLEIKKKPKNYQRQLKMIILIGIIISQMILLIPSYYAGWMKGEYYFEEKMAYVHCYSLTHGTECLDPPPFHGMPPAFERLQYLEVFNFLVENDLGIFGEENFNQQNRIDVSNFNSILQNNEKIEYGFGKIEQINKIKSDGEIITIADDFIHLEGWILNQNKKPVERIFLIVDDKPLLQYDDFILRSDLPNQNNAHFGWSIIFLSGYVEKGCHEISIVGESDNTIIKLNDLVTLCRS